jgi:hypothetical protein
MRTFTWASATASGHAKSEDRVDVNPCGDALVVTVADGAGGARGGGAAADAVVAKVVSLLVRPKLDPFDTRIWSQALIELDGELHRSRAGEATAVIAVVTDHGLCGVSVGDSEAWMVVDGRVEHLTNAQDRARVGSGRANPVVFHRPKLVGSLVVATDGLFKHTPAQAIATCTPMDANKLVTLPRLPSGMYPDDVAVAVVT